MNHVRKFDAGWHTPSLFGFRKSTIWFHTWSIDIGLSETVQDNIQ